MISLFKVAHAQTFSEILSRNPVISPLFRKIADNIISPIVAVLFGLAFLVFIWGIFGMILSAEDSDKRKNAQNSVLWGIVGMIIMISVYGIIRLIANTIGVSDPFN